MIGLLLLAVTFFKHQLGSILFEFQTILRPIVFFLVTHGHLYGQYKFCL